MASTRKNRTPDPAVLERIKSDMREAHINGEEFPGKYFELAIAHMLMTYVNNMDPSGVPAGKTQPAMGVNLQRDILYGTDLFIDDPTRMIASRRITRLDLTTGFTGKNNMPLITPTDKMSLTEKNCNRGIVTLGPNGDYLRFGIRIGNGKYGFNHPVVVVGLCSGKIMDDQRLEQDIAWMYENALKCAPELIQTANRVLNRFQYMTDGAYRAKLDKAYSPDEIRRRYPVLVPNMAYLDMEQEYRYSDPEKSKHPKTCRAHKIDGAGLIARHPYTDDFIMVYTDVPWMSPMGHAAVAAMTQGPRKIPNESQRRTLDRILAEPVREPSQNPAIIVDHNNQPLEKDRRSQKLFDLTRQLSSPNAITAVQYGAPDWPKP